MRYEIPDSACEYRFIHARGPGGQHVNKAATGVELRLHLNKLDIPPGVLHRLKQTQRNRINKDGVLVVQADQSRSQLGNRKAALARVESFINEVWQPPKRRIATKPSKTAKAKRVKMKKQRGEVKNNRKKPGLD